MKNKKDMWWRYPLAALAFITICFLSPLLVYIILSITNLFAPSLYKSGEMWIWLVSYTMGAILGREAAVAITKGKEGFATILMIVYGVYAIAVGLVNGMNWGQFSDSTISFILSGVIAIGIQVYLLLQENKANKEKALKYEAVLSEAKNGQNT